jgi:hypothetical protein
LADELAGALSVITGTYLRTENIYDAVAENIEYLNHPVKPVFQRFLVECELVNSDTKKILTGMKNAFPNAIYREWIDALILCQDDQTKRLLLRPIVSKLSDVKAVSLDLSVAFYEPLKEFITMSLLVVLNIPLMYVLNKEWYLILTTSVPGKIIIAISMGAIFLGLFGLVRNMRKVEI